jgi:flagellar biosynthetic protein FlhB
MSDRQDKTFDPTPRRYQKAREEGNVFRSKEMVSIGSLLFGASTVLFGMPAAFSTLKTLASRVFLGATSGQLTPTAIPVLITDLGVSVAAIMAPFFMMVMTAGIGINLLQSGLNITFKPLEPKGERISPLKGFKRIFSGRSLFELFKSLAKIALVGPIAYHAISSRLPEILVLHRQPIEGVLATAGNWIFVLLAQMILALLGLSAIDFAFEKYRYKKDLMMDHQEVKDEVKEQEGDPHMKGRRRQFARELLRRPRLDHAVLKADVVITNPTHYAVALRYDPTEADAPRVVAKGIRKRALRIKELAREYGIPTVEDRPLARALYDTVPEEREIPEDLYPAVAAILAEIYRRRGRR